MTTEGRSDELREWYAEDDPYGAALLHRIAKWYATYIAVTDQDDLNILALWTAHTYLANELYTTPRLLIDSIIWGSGKTTLLDHLGHLCLTPIHAASLTSPAVIPRLLEKSKRTVLLDKVDRSLRPDRPGVEDLIAILNSGYRFGASRPVSVPVKGGGWDVKDMSTYAPVAMAGNSPHLPNDTLSRSIGILLMLDIDGSIEDSDWEYITDDASKLREAIAAWAEHVRTRLVKLPIDLPERCIGRSREKWRPLKRVAVAAGGDWPTITDRLIGKSIAEDDAEREAGLKTLPPRMVLMIDLYKVWPEDQNFVPTRDLVNKLIFHNPEFWGSESSYGKPLNEQRLGRMVNQAAKVQSMRPDHRGPRGFQRTDLVLVWHRLGVAPLNQSGPLGAPGLIGPESAECTDTAEWAGSNTGSEHTRIGAGRCPHCHWHPTTQGHAPACPSKEKGNTP
jgi:hypothetical protein